MACLGRGCGVQEGGGGGGVGCWGSASCCHLAVSTHSRPAAHHTTTACLLKCALYRCAAVLIRAAVPPPAVCLPCQVTLFIGGVLDSEEEVSRVLAPFGAIVRTAVVTNPVVSRAGCRAVRDMGMGCAQHSRHTVSLCGGALGVRNTVTTLSAVYGCACWCRNLLCAPGRHCYQALNTSPGMSLPPPPTHTHAHPRRAFRSRRVTARATHLLSLPLPVQPRPPSKRSTLDLDRRAAAARVEAGPASRGGAQTAHGS